MKGTKSRSIILVSLGAIVLLLSAPVWEIMTGPATIDSLAGFTGLILGWLALSVFCGTLIVSVALFARYAIGLLFARAGSVNAPRDLQRRHDDAQMEELSDERTRDQIAA